MLFLLLLHLLLLGTPPVDHPGIVQSLEACLVVKGHAFADLLAEGRSVVEFGASILDLRADEVVDYLSKKANTTTTSANNATNWPEAYPCCI